MKLQNNEKFIVKDEEMMKMRGENQGLKEKIADLKMKVQLYERIYQVNQNSIAKNSSLLSTPMKTNHQPPLQKVEVNIDKEKWIYEKAQNDALKSEVEFYKKKDEKLK